jgi:hypothetical protein
MTLHPSLAGRVVYFVGAWALFAMCVVALFFNPILGAIGIVLFGFAAANSGMRLFVPRSYATELDDHGFRVYDSFGRLVHDVDWASVAHLTVFGGNGLRGPGTSQFLAWRCEPRRPGHGRQPWARGGVNNVGEEYDGALPAAYLGIHEMLALFQERAQRAHVARPQDVRPALDVRAQPF